MRSCLIFLFSIFYCNILLANTTYCYGDTCSLSLSEPEEAMKSATPIVGPYLIFDNTQSASGYNIRNYSVPDQEAISAGTEVRNASLQDYGSWGSSQCPKSLNITKSGWQDETWVSLDTNIIAKRHIRTVSVTGSYGLYNSFLDKCTMKNIEDNAQDSKYEKFTCDEGFQVDYGPVCKSTHTSFLTEYPCKAPFSFDLSERKCIAWCPPTASDLDIALGRCVKKPNDNQCAAYGGNPIDLSTGEKIQYQSPDYTGQGIFPLTLVRNYQSYRAAEVPRRPDNNSSTGWKKYYQSSGYPGGSMSQRVAVSFEPGKIPNVGFSQWSHNYHLRLTIYEGDSRAILQRDNGEEYYFDSSNGITFTPTHLTGGVIVKSENNWIYENSVGIKETYDATGRLVLITNQQGASQRLLYNYEGKLESVEDPAKRKLNFFYDNQGRLSSVIDPVGQEVNYGYGEQGNLTQVIFPDDTPLTSSDNPKTIYAYENPINPFALTKQIDANGDDNANWTYDVAGRAIGSVNNNGHKDTSITYDDGTATVTEANGQSRTLIFDDKGRLSSVAGGNCGQCSNSDIASYGYDTNNQLTSKTDFNGIETRYEYNVRGLQAKRTEAYGTALARVTTTEWHTDLSLPIKVASPTQQVEYAYGIRGRLESITETDLLVAESPIRVTTYTYNTTGLLLTINGPRTDVTDITTFAYNAKHDLISITDGTGNITQITSFDMHGHPTTIVDANSITTTLTYDVRNRLTSQTVEGNKTNFEYDNIGQLTKITLPSGAVTNYTYNGARLLIKMSDGQSNSVNYTYDVMGNVTNIDVKDPADTLYATQQQVFDGLNRLTSQIDGLNQTSVFGYDAVGNQVSVKTPLLKETKQIYDALNRLSETTDAKLGKIIYGYDAANNLTLVKTPNNAQTTYSYDGFGNLISQASPDTGTTFFTYDVAGNQLSKTDAKNIIVNYSYDALNRLIGIDYPTDSLDVTLTYDAGINGKGRLSQITDGSGSTVYNYNALGQVSSKTSTVAGKSFSLSYGYNGAGQLTQITQPSGRVVNLTRDTHGLVTGINEVKAGVNQNLLTSASYVPFGSAKSLTFGNGKTTTKTHNLNGQLANIDVSGVYQSSLTYNSDSNITGLANTVTPSSNQSLVYDELDRLTEATGSYGTLGYSYDSASNRMTKTDNSQISSFTYNTESNQLASPYLHDANGNRTKDNKRTYSYGDNNRLTEVINDENGVKTTYLYNGLGQRVKKFNVFGDVYFIYDEQGLLIAEADNTGNVTKEYVYFEGQPLVMLVGE